MKRSFVLTLILLLFTTATYADGNPLLAVWPFGNGKAKTPSFDAGKFSKPAANKQKTGFPSPSQWIDRAEKSTSAAFKKTRETWKGVQDFGKSLNPFVASSRSKKQKTSWLDRIMPKQSTSQQPSTVNEFLSMDRPKY